MSVSSIGAQSQLAIQQLTQMRAQFDDLQRQLSTGLKSSTYAGLGIDRGVTVSLNAQLSAIGGFDNTIDNVMTRITFCGALYMALVCVMPDFLRRQFKVPFYFGGTSIMIVVGVALDTVQQIEAHMLTRHYEGLMRKGRLKGRRG